MLADPDRLISEFGTLLGMPGLRLDAQRHCSLLFDRSHRLAIACDSAGGRLVLHCAVGPLPPAVSSDTLIALLRANYLWRGAHGATLSLDPDGRQVTLMLALSLAGLDTAQLNTAVEKLLDSVDAWQRFLADPQRGDPGPALAPLRFFDMKA
ncbi:type III secretion system chaperone [Chitinimonas lacunae]|uniref:Type III secretion system chaperone n=1 Tax=Chitinimonas lacunae TaxID=1963018 RepID=A0ABV8MPU9_9NEIS